MTDTPKQLYQRLLAKHGSPRLRNRADDSHVSPNRASRSWSLLNEHRIHIIVETFRSEKPPHDQNNIGYDLHELIKRMSSVTSYITNRR